MKIAKYKVLSCGIETCFGVNDFIEGSNDHVRLTEIVDVNFEPLNNDELIKDQIKSIDSSIKASMKTTDELKQQRSNLLALPDQSKGEQP
jgi:hypothetical protein